MNVLDLDIGATPAALLRRAADDLYDGKLVPYLGPGVATLDPARTSKAPATYDALATFIGSKIALPKRVRGNPWASAQYVESQRHRATLTALMADAFAQPVAPTKLHHLLAAAAPPLIVDTWYDGAMRTALGPGNWGEIQGTDRAGPTLAEWYRAYRPDGSAADLSEAVDWQTILYKPHGGVDPARNFLIADSDYVEVLTEIDIQTPIPTEVKQRRAGKRFLFLGCRFDDQLLRSYARQILKRTGGQHLAVLDPATLTRNEQRFLADLGILPIALPLDEAVALLGRG